MVFKKGNIPWIKNKKHTEIALKKMSINHKGKLIGNLNPMKRPEVAARVSLTRKRLFREGKLKSWQKGLTKETDERIKRYAKKKIGTKNPYTTKRNIENNPMKNPLTREKMSNTKKRLFQEGKLVPWSKGTKGLVKSWCKGLTKETDERVKKVSNSLRGHQVSDETRLKLKKPKSEECKIKQSETKKRLYAEGKLKNWNAGKECPQLSGKNNPMWKGGISFEPYGLEFNEKLREQIRKRDDYTCQECWRTQQESKKKLNTHHIDYCKQNNSIFNLISLCNKCHTKTNVNRKHWTDYFKMKIFIKEFFNPENIKVFNENRKLIAMEKL